MMAAFEMKRWFCLFLPTTLLVSVIFSFESSNSSQVNLNANNQENSSLQQNLVLDTLELFNIEINSIAILYDSSFSFDIDIDLQAKINSTTLGASNNNQIQSGNLPLLKFNPKLISKFETNLEQLLNVNSNDKVRKFVVCFSSDKHLKYLFGLAQFLRLFSDSLRHKLLMIVVTKRQVKLSQVFNAISQEQRQSQKEGTKFSRPQIFVVEPSNSNKLQGHYRLTVNNFGLSQRWTRRELAKWSNTSTAWQMLTKTGRSEVKSLSTAASMSGGSDYNQTKEKEKKPRKHLIIAAIEVPPFMARTVANDAQANYKTNNKTQQTSHQWHGYCMDFFLELVKYLPYELSWEIYQPADNRFGSKSTQVIVDKTNASHRKLDSWNGIIGELQSGRADLALTPLAVMAERELVVDFTVPFYDLVGIQILLKKPQVPQEWFKFLTVLDNEVWLFIGVAYFVTSFVMFVFDRLSPYSHKNRLRIDKIHAKLANKQQRRRTKAAEGANFKDEFVVKKDAADFELNGSYLTKSHTLFAGSLAVPADNFGAIGGGGGGGGENMAKSRRRSSTFHDYLKTLQYNLGVGHKHHHKHHHSHSRSHSHNYQNGHTLSTDNLNLNVNISKQATNHPAFNSLTRPISEESNSDSSSSSSSSSDSSDGQVNDDRPDFNFRDSLWFCITSLTPQGGGEAPQNLSGRIVAGSWWLFCFIILASYTANLAAFLTVSRLDIPIESLDDLAKQYRIRYAPADGSAEQTYFERMANIEEVFYNIWKEMSLNNSYSAQEQAKFAVWDYPISDKYTKIWNQIQQVGMPMSLDAGLERVKSSSLDDSFALLADANQVKYAVMTDCSLKAVGDEFSRKPIALAVRKGQDEFREQLSYAILQLINQRFMEVLREKWWTNNPQRLVCETDDESDGVSAQNFSGVFVIIIAGVVLSFLVWAFELYLYKTKKAIVRQRVLDGSMSVAAYKQ